MKTVFVDAFFLIATNIMRDQSHQQAHRIMRSLESEGTQFATTDAVLAEFCNALSKAAVRSKAVDTIHLLRSRDDFDIIHITQEVFNRAFVLYESRPDKDWGLTDCMSFEVMKSQRIKEALTADHHFAQAGFKTLM